ncbi:hypothetical protein RHSIM_Rhsim01G0156500 [Rhododendron simsii]|uniref:ATP-dependent DNA helicase n=1 Tax=Rhododendron simsii TaxID=118357 RepID=A0A834HF75_RHOSS|nr:hypothetical protein RHSIM_Rhsim01G0156500 [Rhododendron simsii]
MLIESTNPDFTNKYQDIGYLQERAILAPMHDDVDEINNIMLSMLPREMRIDNSADKLCPTKYESNDQDMHPPELLHSLNFPGLPNHCLKLKVGTPIILRNVNLSLGVCNGTRLIGVKMGNLELLELLGMPILKSKGEAEGLCAQLNGEGQVDACLTTDSDAFLFGVIEL